MLELRSGGIRFDDGTTQTTAATPPGGLVVNSADVVVSSAAYDSTTVILARAGTLSTSAIQSWLVPNADFDVDDLIGVSVYVQAMTDSIAVTITENGPIVGTYTINYVVS